MTLLCLCCVQLDDWVLCRIYKKSSQASPMVPPLADYEHLDHDEPSPGGCFDDFCTSFYATPAGKNLVKAQPQLSQAMLTGMQQWMGTLLPQLKEKVEKAAAAHGWSNEVKRR